MLDFLWFGGCRLSVLQTVYQFGSFEAAKCVADEVQEPSVVLAETRVISSVVSLLLLYCAFEAAGSCSCSQPDGHWLVH